MAPGFYRANPAQLRFTQSDASPFFSKGGTIDSLVGDLRAGRVTADQVGDPLQVVMHQGKPFSIDNRRVVAFSQAGVRKLEKIGALTAVGTGEQVVPAGELDAARRRIADLERLLGRKTLENCCPRTSSEARLPGPGCGAQPCHRTVEAARPLARPTTQQTTSG